ncbi:hypothetical protein MPSEU_001085200 [Mayamaea pseudoterrestris]|nr:hypothetical protein MPSEU_001085200 [Mayamaea pseudoterrestris]
MFLQMWKHNVSEVSAFVGIFSCHFIIGCAISCPVSNAATICRVANGKGCSGPTLACADCSCGVSKINNAHVESAALANASRTSQATSSYKRTKKEAADDGDGYKANFA